MVGAVRREPAGACAVDGAPATRLRPHRWLLWHGLTACVAFLTPVFALLYVMAVPNGSWPWVLALQAIVSVVVAVGCVRFFRTAIWVHPEGISERGYVLGKRHFPGDQVDSIVRARTFGHASEVIEQLFACDAAGRCLVRMRGQFWSREDMDTVIETLGVPVTVLGEIMTLRELAVERPILVSWFERF